MRILAKNSFKKIVLLVGLALLTFGLFSVVGVASLSAEASSDAATNNRITEQKSMQKQARAGLGNTERIAVAYWFYVDKSVMGESDRINVSDAFHAAMFNENHTSTTFLISSYPPADFSIPGYIINWESENGEVLGSDISQISSIKVKIPDDFNEYKDVYFDNNVGRFIPLYHYYIIGTYTLAPAWQSWEVKFYADMTVTGGGDNVYMGSSVINTNGDVLTEDMLPDFNLDGYLWKWAGDNPVGQAVYHDGSYKIVYGHLPSFSVIFWDWNNTKLSEQWVQEGYSATAPSDPTRDGYTFVGWDRSFNNITHHLDVYALYEKIGLEQYTVQFLDWDRSLIIEQVVDKGGNATPPASPTRVGYTFIGWDKPYTNIQSNTVITAQYKENTTPPIETFTVTFKDWNGTILSTQTIEKGSSVTPPSNPTREGYTFTGWDKPLTNIQQDTTITAQYTPNSSGHEDDDSSFPWWWIALGIG